MKQTSKVDPLKVLQAPRRQKKTAARKGSGPVDFGVEGGRPSSGSQGELTLGRPNRNTQSPQIRGSGFLYGCAGGADFASCISRLGKTKYSSIAYRGHTGVALRCAASGVVVP